MEERIKNHFLVRIATKRILPKEHFWIIRGNLLFLASIRRVKNFFWILFDAHPTSRELTVLSINDEPCGSEESSHEVNVDNFKILKSARNSCCNLPLLKTHDIPLHVL